MADIKRDEGVGGRRHSQRAKEPEKFSRKKAIVIGGGLAAAGILAYLTSIFGSSKDRESGPVQIGTPLPKDTLVNLGRLNLENKSRVVSIAVIPQNLPDDIATDIGLKILDYPITISFQDIVDADPSTPGDQIATSFYDPKTSDRAGVIAVTNILNNADSQRNLPNSPIKDQSRYLNYLGILFSQAVVVEAYNQGHVDQSTDGSRAKAIDHEANQLGLQYIDRIKNGSTQPFIVVNGVNR